MNKKLLLLAGAMSALFASKPTTTTTSSALEPEPATGAVDIHVAADTAPAPATPATPATLPVVTHQVAVRTREIGATDFHRFVEQPGRRKVKYGKCRWVILG